jgi:hypothetical protein
MPVKNSSCYLVILAYDCPHIVCLKYASEIIRGVMSSYVSADPRLHFLGSWTLILFTMCGSTATMVHGCTCYLSTVLLWFLYILIDSTISNGRAIAFSSDGLFVTAHSSR